LPEKNLKKVNEKKEKGEPQADIKNYLQCPNCCYRWNAIFDIATFLWAELNQWAEQMLYTIHRLAINYGWSESEILQLSPTRRQLYLGMLEK